MTIHLGLSCFRFSVAIRGNNHRCGFYILVNEERFAFMDAWFYHFDSTPSESATINLELLAGQTVRVENIGPSVVYGTSDTGFLYSWFTGHLLHAM